MPTINFSVTQSIDTLAVNLSASEALVMNINNPLVGASYFGLETIPDSNGVYTSASPKNTSGSFTLGTGIIGLVKDDYKMSAVVSPGNNVLTFSPAVAVTGSTLRTRGINSSTSYDADALAFFTRVGTAGGALSGVEMYAVNQLVLDLKANSLWTPMKAIYPMVGSSAAACAQNLKSSSFTGTFTSGWTFASTGVTPNGTSAYMDTNLIPNTSLLLDSSHISYYSRTNANGTEVEIGNNTASSGAILEIRTAGVTYYRINSGGTYISYTDSDSRAFYLANRTASNVINGWRNSSKVATGTVPSAFLADIKLFLGAYNNAGIPMFFSTKQCAFASIGDGLTDTQAAALYTNVQTFQTTLSRNV